MTAYYLDASAAVKAYSQETGSERVREILEHGVEVNLSRVGVVEVAAALFGKTKADEMRVEEAEAALEEFRTDVEGVYRIIEVDPVTADRGVDVARRHRLRAYDCLQLATALLLQEQRALFDLPPLVLVSSDAELNAAAQSQGLAVEDPAAGLQASGADDADEQGEAQHGGDDEADQAEDAHP